MLTTITEPTEGIYLVERNVQAFVGEKCLGKGPLYVSEEYVTNKLREANIDTSNQEMTSLRSFCVNTPMYTLSSYLSWCDALSAKGFSLEYPNISLHAVSKDTSHFPYECVFCMVEGAFEGT